MEQQSSHPQTTDRNVVRPQYHTTVHGVVSGQLSPYGFESGHPSLPTVQSGPTSLPGVAAGYPPAPYSEAANQQMSNAHVQQFNHQQKKIKSFLPMLVSGLSLATTGATIAAGSRGQR